MLLTSAAVLIYIGTASAAVVSKTQHAVQSLITSTSEPEEELRKRYIIQQYYTIDWSTTATCGIIQPATAVQNGLYGTKTAASITAAPLPLTCYGACANSGKYVSCVSFKEQMVGTGCVDYATSLSTSCSVVEDGPCYWYKTCKAASPYCISYLYSGSITQFDCGISRLPTAIPVDSASLFPFTYLAASTTSGSSTSSYSTSRTGTATSGFGAATSGSGTVTSRTATATSGYGTATSAYGATTSAYGAATSGTATATSTSAFDPGSDSMDTPSASTIENALKKIGLSVGALAGICAGALVACCAACCGCFHYKKRRDAKNKYKTPYGHEPALLVSQPLMGHPPAYHQPPPPAQYYHKQAYWTAVPQA